MQGYMKRNTKSSDPYYTSNQVLLYCLGPLYTCFTGIWALRQFGETRPKYLKSCLETHTKQSKFSILYFTLSNVLLKCQGNLRVELYLFQSISGISTILGKLGPSALIFLKLSNFIILRYGVLSFQSRMGSINSFGQAFQELLLNNYLKSNLENSEIRDFVPTFWNFISGKSS